MIVDADLRVPGDKSLTHRMLILAGMAPGTSRIRRALTSFDARSTARVLRQLGAGVSPLVAGREIEIQGRARFHQADAAAPLRELRHLGATPPRHPVGAPVRLDAHRGRFPAPPPDAQGDRATGADGRALHLQGTRRIAGDGAWGRSGGNPIRVAGLERAAQERAAARRRRRRRTRRDQGAQRALA